MPSYRELLAQALAETSEITVEELRAQLDQGTPVTLLDVREEDEASEGRIPGSILVPRGNLELRVESLIPRDAAVVVYCASGIRSAFAARTLASMGYRNVRSLAGGFGRWSDAGFPTHRPPSLLRPDQRARYRRHLTLSEVGEEGQAKLLAGRVLLLGAGGLGSPAALYLAAAGVGTLGIVDSDVVDPSNLQRQVLHTVDRTGQPKTESAREALNALNPDVQVVAFQERLEASNVERILEGFDVVLDGGDNFPTRYLLNDACVLLGKPLIHGSVFRFEGQVTTVLPRQGPCYRCLYPEPPPPELAPSCAEAGVLGVLPGVIGLLQATEAIKLLLGTGAPLVGRLLTYDALGGRFRELQLRRDPACLACADGVRPVLSDAPEVCATPPHARA
jgi:molybdopterin/thiamine biosynthesis adenylyltransferase/rhodanese-related sulfurtransferase